MPKRKKGIDYDAIAQHAYERFREVMSDMPITRYPPFNQLSDQEKIAWREVVGTVTQEIAWANHTASR